MALNIEMTPSVVSCEAVVLGAAIKIALSGGLALDDGAAQRVSGLSRHMWGAHSFLIWQMVKHITTSEV